MLPQDDYKTEIPLALSVDRLAQEGVNFGIITIREDEFDAILDRFAERFPIKLNNHYYEGACITNDQGDSCTVAMVRCPEQGNLVAQSVAHDLIEDLKPEWIILTGIAGGIPDTEYSLGDVLLANRLHDFSISAMLENGHVQYDQAGGPMHPQVQPILGNLPAFVKRELAGWNTLGAMQCALPKISIPASTNNKQLYGDESWKKKVLACLKSKFKSSRDADKPLARAAAAANANMLIKNKDEIERWLDSARSIRHVEMELSGVYQAAFNKQIPLISVRGLSDIVGFKRSPEWTGYACHAAAALTFALIRSGLLRPSKNCPPLPHFMPGLTPEAPGAAGLNRKAIHNLPFTSIGGLLRGRDREVEELTDGGGVAAITQAIQGLGGVGKTRLAIELGWRAVKDGLHAAVLFVTADSPEALQTNLARLAEVLGLAERESPDQVVQVKAVLGWLESRADWLLILDNVDNDAAADAVRGVLPRMYRGRVLITSRLRGLGGGSIKTVKLPVLELDEATRFLLEHAEERTKTTHDEADARRLAELLGGLPLALEQAAAYLGARQGTFADYLRNWERDRKRVLEWVNPADKSLVPVAITWQRTYDGLSPAARAALRLAGLLAPEPIPLALFDEGEERLKEAVALLEEEEQAGAAEALDAREALGELAKYSLLEREEKALTVHRLVQEVVRLRIPQERWREWTQCALACVNDYAPTKSDDVRTWGVWNPLAPHAEAIAKRADEAGIPEPTARLMSCLNVYYKAKGLYARAENWSRRALEIDEAAYGPDHPEVAIRLNNLAQLLMATHRLEEAEPLMLRALEIDEAAYGPDHPEVAIDLNNLAGLLQDTNRLEEAEPMMRRALEIGEAAFGTEHPTVAIRLNNLATLLQDINRLEEAEPLMRRAREIDEAAYGPDHPKVAIRLNNLAQLLQETHRLEEAEPLMRRALAIDEAAFGSDHPNVAIRLGNLAMIELEQSRREQAVAMLQRALAIFRASYKDENHPHIQETHRRLARAGDD